jgi:hypothetical protein
MIIAIVEAMSRTQRLIFTHPPEKVRLRLDFLARRRRRPENRPSRLLARADPHM